MTPSTRLAATMMLVVSLAVVLVRAQQAPTFRAGTTAVRVDVWVGRSDRRVFTGLSATDFRLLDNGVAQDVTDLQYGKLPIDVTIALDVSHSVTGRILAELRDAITELMHDLGPTDWLKLMFFDERVIRAVDFTGDATQVDAALQSATAGGGTSLFDAMSVALLLLGPRPSAARDVLHGRFGRQQHDRSEGAGGSDRLNDRDAGRRRARWPERHLHQRSLSKSAQRLDAPGRALGAARSSR